MNFNLTVATRIGLNLLALLGVIVALRLGESIFIPLVIAVLLASILWPSAVRLNGFYRLPWPLACTVAVGTLVMINLFVVAGFVLSVPRLLQSVPNPNDEEAQKQFYVSLRNQVQNISPAIVNDDYLPEKPEDSTLFTTIKQTLNGEYLTKTLFAVAAYVGNYLWQFILILFILLFLLMEGRMLTRRVVEIFGPSPQVQSKVATALSKMALVLRTFLIWRTLINFGLGVVLGLTFQFLGLKQAWAWALLIGVLFYIPYLGPIIAGVPPLLDAFVNCPSPWYAVGLLVFYVGVVTLEGYVIVPLLMGRHMDLNATTVMLACLFWDLVWGTPGLFLAMPLMAAFKAVCEQVPGWQPWANLMSSREVDEPPGPPAPAVALAVAANGADPDQTVLMEAQPAVRK
jgi:predicted PurR-regulated permease PerM